MIDIMTRTDKITHPYALQYLERWRSSGLEFTLQKNEDVPNALFDAQVRSLISALADIPRNIGLLYAPGGDGEYTLVTGRVVGQSPNRIYFADQNVASFDGLIAVFV